ncbi:MAG: penicillin-binding transpeptidase domain-containing protein [Thermoanaerobaculia bacterium]
MRLSALAFGLVACLGVAASSGSEGGDPIAPRDRVADLGRFFAGGAPVDATFVLRNGRTGEVIRHDPARAAERLLPASTFKVPHTLIALETGVVSDAEFVIPFDASRKRDGFWSPDWSRDQTLRSAFQSSVYWYYQETARRIGPKRMAEYLKRFGYGNESLAGGVDAFWLEGDLRISADEQVRFLQRMNEGRLGVSGRSLEILRSVMVLDRGPGYTLRGKTGTADVTPTRELAWLVGFVERADETWYFALNLEGEEVWERWGPGAARRKLVSALLRELGALPAPGAE